MVVAFQRIFDDETISMIHKHDVVLRAKNKIDKLVSGSVPFHFSLSNEDETNLKIQKTFQETLGINLTSKTSIPMRWIKGDTLPHVDQSRSEQHFENTYLVYLTSDEQGKLFVEDEIFPIASNVAYKFEEGLSHKTIGCDTSTPRLLIGPMNEFGNVVGAGSTIYAAPPTVVFIKQISSNIYYSVDNEANYYNLYFPCTIVNTNTSAGDLEIQFTTDLNLSTNYDYFICGSSNLQFGSKTLKVDGSRPIITIGVDNFDGLFANGSSATNGFDYVNIFNLVIDGTGHFTQIGGAWFCQKYWANGALHNYIINCSAIGGQINGGGICADYAGCNGGNLTIEGCSSNGTIANSYAGGICGSYMSSNNGQVSIKSCWSEGDISGDFCGGIAGSFAGTNIGSITIRNCYSSGQVSGQYAGGISGFNSGLNGLVLIEKCYSFGAVSNYNSGGIIGTLAIASSDSLTCIITNCYSIGAIDSSLNAGAISGILENTGIGTLDVTISNCYASGNTTSPKGYIVGNDALVNIPGVSTTCYSEAANSSSGWTTSNANTVLLGVPSSQPGVGSTWVSTNISSSYELLEMGCSPYTTNNIAGNPPTLVRTSSFSVAVGSSSSAGKVSTYLLISINPTEGTITINPTTGQLITTSSTSPNTYTVYVRNTGSYSITAVTLLVTSAPVPCLIEGTNVLTPLGYRKVEELQKGQYVLTSDHRQVKIVNVYKSVLQGNPNSYPCLIKQGAIAPNYPPNDLRISQKHMIRYTHSEGVNKLQKGTKKQTEYWVMPAQYFSLDTSISQIKYYHIQLRNYKYDHLVINDGVVVESFGSTKEDFVEYRLRMTSSVFSYGALREQFRSKKQINETLCNQNPIKPSFL